MNRIVPACLVFGILVFPFVAHAAVFERDWKTPGDGLLTYDDVNQRVWLDLSVSQLSNFLEPRLANAVAQIAPDGLFDGFTWAKSKDVNGMVLSAGIDPTTIDYARNAFPVTQLINLLGATVQNSATIRSVGLIDEASQSQRQLGTDLWVTFAGSGHAGIFNPIANDSIGDISNGLMLYHNVPEPATLMLIVGGCWAVMTLVRRPRVRKYRPPNR